jgi:hypothetical protein
VVFFMFNCLSCEFESRSWWGFLNTTLCDKVCQWLATGRWFSPGPPVSTTNKTDCHDTTEILLKVVLNTINQTHLQKDHNVWNGCPGLGQAQKNVVG